MNKPVSRDILTGVPLAPERAASEALDTLNRLSYTPLVPVENGRYLIAPDGRAYTPLTTQQRIMAQTLFETLTVEERMYRAGSKASPSLVSNPHTRAAYNNSPVFINYILELWTEYKQVSTMNREEYKHEIHRLGKEAQAAGKYSVAKSCLELRGRLEGFFDKDQGGNETPAEKTLKSVTEELESLLNDARQRKEKVISEQ
jgi:hypothetical protein